MCVILSSLSSKHFIQNLNLQLRFVSHFHHYHTNTVILLLFEHEKLCLDLSYLLTSISRLLPVFSMCTSIWRVQVITCHSYAKFAEPPKIFREWNRKLTSRRPVFRLNLWIFGNTFCKKVQIHIRNVIYVYLLPTYSERCRVQLNNLIDDTFCERSINKFQRET